MELLPITDPDAYRRTRTGWHAVAERVLAPARHAAAGRIGLRVDPEGIVTPPFGPDDRRLRLTPDGIEDVTASASRREPLTTLGAAAHLVGVDPATETGLYTPTTPVDPALEVGGDPAAARSLVAWYRFGQAVLDAWRTERDTDTPSEIQLWPEHFDLALDLGPVGGRANYGASPGDAGHELPYLYVGPWEPDDDPFWNAGTYARLGHDHLAARSDPVAAALAFFRNGYAAATRASRKS
jgi:hypothetical protein